MQVSKSREVQFVEVAVNVVVVVYNCVQIHVSSNSHRCWFT